MNLHQLFLRKNDCYKAGRTIIPKGIMVHSTGANNPNLRRYVGPDDGLLGRNTSGNHWNNPKPGGSQVCVHAFIGKLKDGSIATYQTLPWNFRGWHAGGSANDTHIGFEICEDNLSDGTYFSNHFSGRHLPQRGPCSGDRFQPRRCDALVPQAWEVDGYFPGRRPGHAG